MKEIFPPRARLRWLLMTMRLSNSSFTGTARTDVAVGSSSEAFMFFATAAAGPRRVTSSGPSGAAPASLAGAAALRLRLGGGLGRRGRGGGLRGRSGGGGRGGLRGSGRRRLRLGRGGSLRLRGGGGRWRAAGVRGHRGGRRLRRRSGLVVGEEVPPGSVHGVRVLEVLLIDLVDEPLIGTERGRGVLSRVVRLVGVGRDARVTGGLWRHGENRPLPLHKMVDSGNQGYAYRPPKVRLGRSIVA
ncbi:hypothetical protein STENM327S_05045 [Streptomyces tendae]